MMYTVSYLSTLLQFRIYLRDILCHKKISILSQLEVLDVYQYIQFNQPNFSMTKIKIFFLEIHIRIKNYIINIKII